MSINTKIIGIGSYVPEKVVTNAMLEDLVDTSDEWITKRTGIRTRHVSTEDTATSMATKSAKQAMEHAGIEANDVDIMVCATITSDMSTPCTAGIVQKNIGCNQAIAMDISAGCTGFIYALTTAISLMDTLNKDTALVMASENFTTRVDWTDRSTCILFGDGAGAVVVKRSESNYIMAPKLYNIPDKDNVLYMENVRVDNPWSEGLATDGIGIQMDGQKVFQFAVNAFQEALDEVAKESTKQITKIIPHQANDRIIQYMAKSSGFSRDKFYVNIDKYANTSSATIPLAICDAYKEGWIEKGDVIAMIGFGAGLSYGGIVVEWDL